MEKINQLNLGKCNYEKIHYFVVTFDINNDGKEDKIISNKPNKGNSLLVYFSKGAGYVLKLESINFSQDGGHQIKKIEKNNKGFTIITAFPKGTDKYSYFISHYNISDTKKLI